MEKWIQRIAPINEEAGKKARHHIDQLTKPQGSLGRLEETAIRLAEITGDMFPDVTPPGVIVFAGDHGIAEEGVSAYPKEVTSQMVLNFVNGGAAINVFARQIGATFHIVDMGVAQELPPKGVISRKIRFGTANFLREDAMSREEAEQAIETGFAVAEQVIAQGAKCLILGEMGIANTSSSTAILAAVSGMDVAQITGRGSGIDESKWNHKWQIIERALAARIPDPNDPLDILSKVGGLEIGGMAGAILGAAAHRIPVILDGFICSSAAVLASMMCSHTKDYMMAAHLSQEPGHRRALEILQKKPFLDLDLRLGEGSGAALAFPLVEASARMIKEMATFSSAGVSDKS